MEEVQELVCRVSAPQCIKLRNAAVAVTDRERLGKRMKESAQPDSSRSGDVIKLRIHG